jgi:hypothetical protein
MNDDFSLPPLRDLPARRLAQRTQHLHKEITKGPSPRFAPAALGRSLGTRRPPLALIGAAVAIALAVPALAFSGVLDSLFGLSNGGTSVSTAGIDLNDVQILRGDHIDVGGQVTLLAARGSTAFYVTRTNDGRTCLLTGPAAGNAPTRITINTPCERDFPSATQPILGFYALRREPGSRVQSIAALRGLAADGVATVVAVDANGNVLLSAPVKDNVYSADRIGGPAAATSVARIEARDSAGAVVYTEPIPRPFWEQNGQK